MIVSRIKRYIRKRANRQSNIDPDEIMLDSQNLPNFDLHQLHGNIEKPISILSIFLFSLISFFLISILAFRAWTLQVNYGEQYMSKSENNRLRHEIVFADRGAIFDSRNERLAWNSISPENEDFSLRSYIKIPGFSHLLGYINYPAKDKNGFYYRKDFEGIQGVEAAYNDLLKGKHGLRIIETDAINEVSSEFTIEPPKNGQNIALSIDSRVQAKLYEYIKELSLKVGFTGGAGAIMDINTGEFIAMTSYPEYDSNAMNAGDSVLIAKYTLDERSPFLNRFTTGLYTPGSTIKPYVAIAALSEKIISPNKEILSTGSISVPNPYDKTKKTIFSDWKAHGYVDMVKALAVSSNVYFYEIGGGYGEQKGLGVEKMAKYFALFDFGKANEDSFFGGPSGTIPNPDWKEKTFPGDPWRIGDTYFTAIGQYGFQVTPLQELRAVSAIANGGFLLEPSILKIASSTKNVVSKKLPFSNEEIDIIKRGMRGSVEYGTASGINVSFVDVAGKTGTAELGLKKQFVNSWVVGFLPYQKPKYAFVVIMERGPRDNLYGGVFVIRSLLDWMNIYTPEYLK